MFKDKITEKIEKKERKMTLGVVTLVKDSWNVLAVKWIVLAGSRLYWREQDCTARLANYTGFGLS